VYQAKNESQRENLLLEAIGPEVSAIVACTLKRALRLAMDSKHG
jgi:hypothetical protein